MGNKDTFERFGDDALARLVASVFLTNHNEEILVARHPKGFYEAFGGKGKKYEHQTKKDNSQLLPVVEPPHETARAELIEELQGFPSDYAATELHALTTHVVSGRHLRHITRFLALLPDGYKPILSCSTDHTELGWVTSADLSALSINAVIEREGEKLVQVGERFFRAEVRDDLVTLLQAQRDTGTITTACRESRVFIKPIFYDPRRRGVLLRKKAGNRGFVFPQYEYSISDGHLHAKLWRVLREQFSPKASSLLGKRVWLSTGLLERNKLAWVHFYMVYNHEVCENVKDTSDWHWVSLDKDADRSKIDPKYCEEVSLVREKIKELLQGSGLKQPSYTWPYILPPQVSTVDSVAIHGRRPK